MPFRTGRFGMKITLDWLGSVLFVLITIAVVLAVVTSGLMKDASDDLFASLEQARGRPLQTPRTQPGVWLSARLSADLAQDNLSERNKRADQLRYRSERVREWASVGALLGLLVAVLTARPGIDTVRGSAPSSPTANTASSGTA
jgi:hypothetical protein